MGAAPLKTVHTVLIHIVSLATAVLGIYSHKIKKHVGTKICPPLLIGILIMMSKLEINPNVF